MAGWTFSSPLPNARAYACGVHLNGKLYIIGGASALSAPTNYSDLQFASINGDGSLGPWQVGAPALDTSKSYSFAFVQERNQPSPWLYVLGGNQMATATYSNLIYYGKIENTGQVNAWLTTQLPVPLAGMGGALWNDKLYLVGGVNAGGNQTAVYRYHVLPGGGLEELALVTSLPTSVAYPTWTAWAANKVLWAYSNGNLLSAPIQDDDSLGLWTVTPVPNVPGLTGAQMLIDNNTLQMHISGGNTGSAEATSVQTAQVDSNAHASRFYANMDMLAGREGHEMLWNKSRTRIWVMGGANFAGSGLSDVLYTDVGADGSMGGVRRSVVLFSNTNQP